MRFLFLFFLLSLVLGLISYFFLYGPRTEKEGKEKDRNLLQLIFVRTAA